jgi:hypothetical protein
VKCPKCGVDFQVPRSAQDDEPVEVPGAKKKGRRCPDCNEPLAKDAVLCVSCGLNLETGKKLGPAVKEKEFVIGPKGLGLTIIRDAKGRLTLHRRPGCLAFLLPTQTFKLTRYDSIVISYSGANNTTNVELAGPNKRPILIWQGTDSPGGWGEDSSEDQKKKVIADLKNATNFEIRSGQF